MRALHVEKPLCNSMAEWQALVERLTREDAFVTYGALRRHLPVFRAALAHAQSGALGELREVRVQLGAGSLFWTQTHAIDLLLFAAGGRRLRACRRCWAAWSAARIRTRSRMIRRSFRRRCTSRVTSPA